MPVIRLVRSGIAFHVEPNETIMEGAERAGVSLAHNCLSGSCRACLTHMLAGTVEHDPDRISYLNIRSDEIEKGYRLLCSAFARTDVELDR